MGKYIHLTGIWIMVVLVALIVACLPSQIQATGTDFKKASIVIPADRIKYPDCFIEANIRAGSPQSSMFVNPTIVDMKWNLRKRVTLNSF
ncbi:MAG: hypothetical protein IKQ79_02990 [Bacteroidales bacterium]|nr:hypothetical protein [Bacteroidales bacterium]